MSRHLAAYFAIVGTLAFASGGAASAGQVNIPQINIPRPQINIPRPQVNIPRINIPRPEISVPTPHLTVSKITTPNLVLVPKVATKATKSNNNLANVTRTSFGTMRRVVEPIRATDTISPSGGTVANPVSNTGGAYPTAETFRCRSKDGASNCRG